MFNIISKKFLNNEYSDLQGNISIKYDGIGKYIHYEYPDSKFNLVILENNEIYMLPNINTVDKLLLNNDLEKLGFNIKIDMDLYKLKLTTPDNKKVIKKNITTKENYIFINNKIYRCKYTSIHIQNIKNTTDYYKSYPIHINIEGSILSNNTINLYYNNINKSNENKNEFLENIDILILKRNFKNIDLNKMNINRVIYERFLDMINEEDNAIKLLNENIYLLIFIVDYIQYLLKNNVDRENILKIDQNILKLYVIELIRVNTNYNQKLINTYIPKLIERFLNKYFKYRDIIEYDYLNVKE